MAFGGQQVAGVVARTAGMTHRAAWNGAMRARTLAAGLGRAANCLSAGQGAVRSAHVYRERSAPKPRDKIEAPEENYPLVPGPPTMTDVMDLLKGYKFTDAFRAAATRFTDPAKPGLESFKADFGVEPEQVKKNLIQAYTKFNQAMATCEGEKLKTFVIEGTELHKSCNNSIKRQQDLGYHCDLKIEQPELKLIAFNSFRRQLHNRELIIYQALAKFKCIQDQTFYKVDGSIDSNGKPVSGLPINKTTKLGEPFLTKDMPAEEYVFMIYNFDPYQTNHTWKLLGVAKEFDVKAKEAEDKLIEQERMDKHKQLLESSNELQNTQGDETKELSGEDLEIEEHVDKLLKRSYYEERVLKREYEILEQFEKEFENIDLPKWAEKIKVAEGYKLGTDPIKVSKSKIGSLLAEVESLPKSIQRFEKISRATIFAKDYKEDKFIEEVNKAKEELISKLSPNHQKTVLPDQHQPLDPEIEDDLKNRFETIQQYSKPARR